ncbi:MAG: HD domain-containing protein [Chloroflexi bacterium]|nr:HD domain-containing protein [Chloroflexota bacterium]
MKLSVEPEVWSVLARAGAFLAEQGIKSYLTGGFVRDVLLGRHTADIDIAVLADALEVASGAASALGGRYVVLDEANKVGRVVLLSEERWQLDFSTIKVDIEHDLAQRDFTVNAMAVDLEGLIEGQGEAQLIDPFGGQHDLGRGVLRVVAAGVFEADAARLLRAVRLAAELGFSIDSDTEALLRLHSRLVARVAGERTREELLRLLSLCQSGRILTYLDDVDLLMAMIPEMERTKGAEQPKEHFWDVFHHSVEAVAAVDFLLRRESCRYAGDDVLSPVPWSPALAGHFNQEVNHGSTRRSLLKVAALLHDIAKPETRSIEGGRVRFLGHPQEGAAMAASILERLRFSAREIKAVATMVKYHLRPTQMTQDGLPSRRAVYRYFRDVGDTGIDILFLSLADHLATRGPHLDLAQWRGHTELAGYVLARRFEEEVAVIPPRLIDGHDLLNIFGLSPGPKVGEILEVVREAQAAGEVTGREEALAYVGRLLVYHQGASQTK